MTHHSKSENQQNSPAQNRDLSAVPPEIRPHVFKPGQSGNPGGRPKKITRVIDKLLDQPYDEHRTYLEALSEETIKRAITKSDFLVKEVFERIDGKVPQAVTGDDGGPVQFQVNVICAKIPEDMVVETLDDVEIVDEK